MTEQPNIDDVINERDGWQRIGFGVYVRQLPPAEPLPVQFRAIKDDDASQFGVIKEADNGLE